MNKYMIKNIATKFGILLLSSSLALEASAKVDSKFDFRDAALKQKEKEADSYFEQIYGYLGKARDHVSANSVAYTTAATLAGTVLGAAYLLKPRRAGNGNGLGNLLGLGGGLGAGGGAGGGPGLPIPPALPPAPPPAAMPFFDPSPLLDPKLPQSVPGQVLERVLPLIWQPYAFLEKEEEVTTVVLPEKEDTEKKVVPMEKEKSVTTVVSMETEETIKTVVSMETTETEVVITTAPLLAPIPQREHEPDERVLDAAVAEMPAEFVALFGHIPGAQNAVNALATLVNDQWAVIEALAEYLDRHLHPIANDNNLTNDDWTKMRDYRDWLEIIRSNYDTLKLAKFSDLKPDAVESPEVDIQDWELVERNDEPQAPIPNRLLYMQDGHVAVHPVMTRETYDEFMKLVDLSYTVAVEFRAPHPAKREAATARIEQFTQDLLGLGWKPWAVIDGKTGANNVDDDKTAIIWVHMARNLIAVAFHGSISNDYGKFDYIHGDWAANWDAVSVLASSLGIEGADDVMVHRGFGNNYASARARLLFELKEAAEFLQRLKGKWPTVIVGGHSKGAAIASIAAPDIKYQLAKEGMDCLVCGFIISAPKAMELAGRAWISRVMGTGNIARINVYGDLATKQPWLIALVLGFHKYVSIGILVKDSIYCVNDRAEVAYGRPVASWTAETWAGFHLAGRARDAGWEFDHRLVISYDEFLRGVLSGLDHMLYHNPAFLDSTFLGGRRPGCGPKEGKPEDPK